MSKCIYVAGPIFSDHEREFLVNMVRYLSEKLEMDEGDDFFLPHRDAGDIGITKGHGKDEVFIADIDRLENAKIIIALLDGQDVDSGTSVELGYAFAKGKIILGLLTDRRSYSFEDDRIQKLNNMIWGVCDNGRAIFRTVDQLVGPIKSSLNAKR